MKESVCFLRRPETRVASLVISASIQETAVASQSLSEEPPTPPPASRIHQAALGFQVLITSSSFQHQSPLQPYINTEPLLLKEAHRSHGPTSLRVMSNALRLFLPLCRYEAETQNTWRVWVKIRGETQGAINSLHHSPALGWRGPLVCSHDAISLFMCITSR